jgi:hypothetical protein
VISKVLFLFNKCDQVKQFEILELMQDNEQQHYLVEYCRDEHKAKLFKHISEHIQKSAGENQNIVRCQEILFRQLKLKEQVNILASYDPDTVRRLISSCDQAQQSYILKELRKKQLNTAAAEDIVSSYSSTRFPIVAAKPQSSASTLTISAEVSQERLSVSDSPQSGKKSVVLPPIENNRFSSLPPIENNRFSNLPPIRGNKDGNQGYRR